MGKLLLDTEANPSAPGSNKVRVLANSTTKKLTSIDDSGKAETLGALTNVRTSDQTGFSSDTYMSGSNISIPPALARVGTIYRFRFDMVKTAAGTAAMTVIVRFGTAGTTSDTARLTFTLGAGT